MPIDPKIEEPTRELLGHVVRGEFEELQKLLPTLSEQRFAECLGLCLRVSGYIAIDVCGHEWPTYAKLHRIAGLMAAIGLMAAMDDMEYELAESDAYDYLARSALGFEPVIEVFPDKGKAGTVPLFVTAALLVAYRPDGRHWWEYLDAIEIALDTAAPLPEDVVPALLLLSRRNHALKERATSTEQAS